MNNLNETFNEYINEFKKLTTMEKLEELSISVKELLSFIDILAQNSGKELSYLTSKEIKDLYKENVSEDDYIEAILVYIENIKNNLAMIIDSTEQSK